MLQTGGTPGFSVAYTRKVFRGEELVRDERWTTRYDPANTIVEVGPPEKKPEEASDGDGEQEDVPPLDSEVEPPVEDDPAAVGDPPVEAEVPDPEADPAAGDEAEPVP